MGDALCLPGSMIKQDASDQHLLREMRAGSEEAFRSLYSRHQGHLYRFVLHMTGCRATAEDVVQDVFMHLIRKSRSYDGSKASLRAYLFGVARNIARRTVAKGQTDLGLDDVAELDLEPTQEGELVERFSRLELLDSLRRAVLGLPEPYREVVVLCDLQEISYTEAAAIIGCSPGTIASRLHRAHNMLRRKIGMEENTVEDRR